MIRVTGSRGRTSGCLLPGSTAARVVVRVFDDLGAPMPGATLTIGNVTGAGGPQLTGETTRITGADGTASITGWIVGSPASWNATPGQGLSILVAGVGSVGVGAAIRYAAGTVVATGSWRELKPGIDFCGRARVLDQFGDPMPNAPIRWQCNDHCGVGTVDAWSSGDGFVTGSGRVLDSSAPAWAVAHQLSFFAVGGTTGGTVSAGWVCGVPSRPTCR